MKSIYGYFSDPSQDKPEFDPGLEVNCPYCNSPLNHPFEMVISISFRILQQPKRSYFYRTHKDCYDKASSEKQCEIESFCIDEGTEH